MVLRWLIRPNAYYDSVKLMRLSEQLAALPGVERAAAVMATPLNVDLLLAGGLLPADADITPDDVLVAIAGESDAVDEALSRVDELLAPAASAAHVERTPVRSLEQVKDATVAIIAVPGSWATAEAFAALRAGQHVFLFSDNVSLIDETRLKQLAAERDLLLMGPDCGTAILNGVGLGFANRVRRGPVGIVGASGTGIQQLCCLLDEMDIGIAQAIGTGGRDLSAEVDASMTRRALHLLAEDPAVEVLVLISKPPDDQVAHRLMAGLRTLRKPVVAYLPGTTVSKSGNVRIGQTLTETACLAAESLGHAVDGRWTPPADHGGHPSFRSYVYGLFAGGTLRDEAAHVLNEYGVPHRLVDLGADEYTQGRAHPMLDPRLRVSILSDVGRHDDAGAVLFDVVLGDLAHPDPAGALVPALKELQSLRAGRPLPVFAALIGTERDPQGLVKQRRLLEEQEVHVFRSNAQAAAMAAQALGGDPG